MSAVIFLASVCLNIRYHMLCFEGFPDLSLLCAQCTSGCNVAGTCTALAPQQSIGLVSFVPVAALVQANKLQARQCMLACCIHLTCSFQLEAEVTEVSSDRLLPRPCRCCSKAVALNTAPVSKLVHARPWSSAAGGCYQQAGPQRQPVKQAGWPSSGARKADCQCDKSG